MANEITEFIDVQITIQDLKVSAAGFGVPMILPDDEHSAFSGRTSEYSTLAEVGVDFATTTKTYKAANAIFAQEIPPAVVKIGRRDSGDSDVADTLAKITDEDADWYCLIIEDRTKAEILAAAVYIETVSKIFLASSEEADVIDAASTTDVAYTLKNLGYNRTAYMWHHQSGVDQAGVAIAVSSLVATVTETDHGLRVGDPITVSGATPAELNGNNIVVAVLTDDTYTYATDAADGAGSGTINVFARYTFPEAAWGGEMLGRYEPGEATWMFKQLVGVAKTPTTLLSQAQKTAALNKNANIYVEVASVGITREGKMASGRYIDLTRGVDWLEARMEERIFAQMANLPKIPYTNVGVAIIENEIRAQLDAGIAAGVLQPLLDDAENRPYQIIVPDVATVSQQDRVGRVLPDIEFKAQAAGAIHKVVVTGNIII